MVRSGQHQADTDINAAVVVDIGKIGESLYALHRSS